MSERQALVEEALKLMQEYPPPEPVRESLSKRASALLTSGHPEQTSTAAESVKAAQPSTGRHDRKCSICRHRDRAEIEEEFLNWRSAESIAKEYGITHHHSIYRHARATGLFAQRATNLRMALSPIIEGCTYVSVSADSVIRAVVAFAHLNDQGQWIEPPKTFIHHRADSAPAFAEELNVAQGTLARHPASSVDGAHPLTNDTENSNRNLQLLEYDSTR